ncbi:alkaline phosphatase D family protein [Flindersiella endophytica]
MRGNHDLERASLSIDQLGPYGPYGQQDRRQFVGYFGLGALALALGPLATQPSTRTREVTSFSNYPFSLGVASGDPLPDSVVLWTRLAPEPLASLGGMDQVRVPVPWQVAEDPQFRRVVRSGTATAKPEYVHSVHVDVRGLRPGREYYYRFKAGNQISPVGRTKTAPATWQVLDDFRFAMVSCQAWFDGYYTAYGHLAEEDVDVVLHLGDYLYEYGVGTNGGRPDATLPDKYFSPTVYLSEYRDRYALYKLDPDLQAAHAAAPWILTWDDHEVVDNYANLAHPSATPEDFLVRRANAYRAYWEHMPLRPLEPVGPDMPIYRRFTFGRLLEFSVLDTRQYRSDQACGDGLRTDCVDRLDPARTLLGDPQEAWLMDGLAQSRTTWNVLAQQIMLSQVDFNTNAGLALSMDLWDGYTPARDRVLAGLVERQVRNPIVLSGDFHRSMAANVKQNFDDPASPTIATEFLGTSISSGMDGADMDEFGTQFLAANDHIKFYNGQRGYVRFSVTPETWNADYRVVPYVRQRGAEVFTRASLVVEAGVPGLQDVSENAARGLAYASADEVEPPEPLKEPEQ